MTRATARDLASAVVHSGPAFDQSAFAAGELDQLEATLRALPAAEAMLVSAAIAEPHDGIALTAVSILADRLSH